MDPLVVLFGLGVGILIGLTGIGGGSLMTPLLILVVGVQPVVAIGTDLAYGAITKTVGGFKHLRSGTVDLGVSKWNTSVPTTRRGVRRKSRISAGPMSELPIHTAALRPALGCVLLGSALGVLSKAGADLSAWVILGVPTAVGALVALAYRMRLRETAVASWARTS
jgi:uncharacterized membrane protein YfcA